MPRFDGSAAGSRVAFGLGAAGLVAAGLVLWVKSGAPTDFSQDYFAARAWQEGHSIYGEEVADLGREHFAAESPGNFHPPTVTVAFIPVSLLPYRLAFVLFGLSTVAVFAASLALAAKAAPLRVRGEWLMVGGLLWWPFWACLTHGQVSMWVAGALTACWLADERGRSAWAGAFAGVATLGKLFPALVGLYFLIRGDRRALASMTLVVAGGLAASAMVVGADDVMRYATEAAPRSAAEWSSHPLNVSLSGALRTLLGDPAWGSEPWVHAPRVATLSTWLLGAALVGATVGRGVGSLRHTAAGRRRLLAGTVVAAAVLSPLTWSHTLAVVLFPLVVQLARESTPGGRWLLVAVAFLLIGFPGPPLGQLVVPWLGDRPIPAAVATLFQAPALGLAVLWWRLILLDRGGN